MFEISGTLNRLFGGEPYRLVRLPPDLPIFYDQDSQIPAENPQFANAQGIFREIWAEREPEWLKVPVTG